MPGRASVSFSRPGEAVRRNHPCRTGHTHLSSGSYMNKNSRSSLLAFVALLVSASATVAAPAASTNVAPQQKLRWVPADLGPGHVTLDGASRLALVRSAAQRAGLHEVGLDFRDVYGVISAETS